MAFFRDQITYYEPPAMSDWQLSGLEQAIAYSQDADSFAKQVIIWTLRQTDRLTKQVALSLPAKFYDWNAKDMQGGAHDMISTGGATHLDTLFKAMHTHMYLMHHCGVFANAVSEKGASHIFLPDAPGNTVWFAYEWYLRNITLLTPPTFEAIEAIDLKEIREGR